MLPVIDLGGDLRTLWPYARQLWAPEPPSAGRGWATELVDPRAGPVRLTGELLEPPGARALVLVVHGLGGSSTSHYCLRAARVASAHGLASLCLNLRGADRRGRDFYNVGLREDLVAALASPELARYESVFLLGYSMGGYVVLRYLAWPGIERARTGVASNVAANNADALDPRVAAAAAVCTPLDLLSAQLHVDSTRAWFYRRQVLASLKSIYAAVAASGAPLPTPLARVNAVRTIHEWDRLTIAPRYGYESPEHYYAALAIAPQLGELPVPTLLVASESDPIIPPSTIRPFLPARTSRTLEVRWIARAGHVAFPQRVELGLDVALDGSLDGANGALDLESQILRWFASRANQLAGS